MNSLTKHETGSDNQQLRSAGQRLVFATASVLFFGFTLSACGSISAGSGQATAKLQFRNSASSSVVVGPRSELRGDSHQVDLLAAATGFRMKLLAAYLAEDVNASTGNNVGTTSLFWLNSECSENIQSCDTDSTVNGGRDEQGNPWAATVTSFFNFTDITAVNTTLNGQGRSITPGTYRYVRLEFCKYAPTAPNIEWTDGSGAHTFAQSSCNVTRALDSPMTVASGEAVTVSLAYTLAGSVNSGSGGSNCASGNCFTLPTFTPTATK